MSMAPALPSSTASFIHAACPCATLVGKQAALATSETPRRTISALVGGESRSEKPNSEKKA